MFRAPQTQASEHEGILVYLALAYRVPRIAPFFPGFFQTVTLHPHIPRRFCSNEMATSPERFRSLRTTLRLHVHGWCWWGLRRVLGVREILKNRRPSEVNDSHLGNDLIYPKIHFGSVVCIRRWVSRWVFGSRDYWPPPPVDLGSSRATLGT